jgi:hypothetical protein
MPTMHTVNMSDPKDKRLVLDAIRALEGPHRIEWCQYRRRRTDRQNRYYWPCFVQVFGDYLRGHGNEFTDEMAHGVLREMFLRVSLLDVHTGEVFSYTKSTTELNTVEFNEYLDKCAAFLTRDCHCRIPEPDVYHERD